jgi:hypothetical protein
MTARTPKPDPSDDAALEHESSSVRPCVRRETARDLEALVRSAETLLADLSPGHPRIRLLKVALVRRDEALLTALLDELSGSSTRHSTLLPPPRSTTPKD